MKIINRNKLAAAGLGLAAFGAVVASAASLGGLTSQSIGGDTAVVASCDSDGVSIAYDSTYSATLGAYEVSSVTVSGIDAACTGETIKVTVHDGSNVALGAGSIAVAGTSQAVSISAGADTSAVTGTAVVISG